MNQEDIQFVSHNTPFANHIVIQLQSADGETLHTHYCTCQLGLYTEEQTRSLGGDVFVALRKSLSDRENK